MPYSINIAKRNPLRDYTIGGQLYPIYSHHCRVILPDSFELQQATDALADLAMRYDERDPKLHHLPLYHLTLAHEVTTSRYVLQNEQIRSGDHWAADVPVLKEEMISHA